MTIEISEYQSEWPERFTAERDFLAPLLRPWLVGAIEHIGSTAVPGLAAKPVIDLMAGVSSLEASREAIAVIGDKGYCYYPYKADIMHWFCKPTPTLRTHHLHLVPYDSPLWRDQIRFRDLLRQKDEIRRAYEALKKDLAARFTDRDAYTQHKSSFIADALASI